MQFFLPKQVIFFDLFKQVSQSLKEIVILFGELANNFNDFESYAQRAEEIEHRGDEKTHEIIDKLNKTFITPIDREDIHMLAGEMDDIIDLIENAINNIYIYKVTAPVPAIQEFARLMNQAAHFLEQLLACLEKQKYTKELVEVKIKIHELEDQADAAFERAMKELFANHTDPIVVIKLKDILECLEHIMDKFQKVADLIEGIMVKSN